METTINAEIDEAVAFAKASPFPTRDQMTTHVFAP
jgi:TPP-dependent pyruvate/acetoin dehydrogenase alpha subunit